MYTQISPALFVYVTSWPEGSLSVQLLTHNRFINVWHKRYCITGSQYNPVKTSDRSLWLNTVTFVGLVELIPVKYHAGALSSKTHTYFHLQSALKYMCKYWHNIYRNLYLLSTRTWHTHWRELEHLYSASNIPIRSRSCHHFTNICCTTRMKYSWWEMAVNHL